MNMQDGRAAREKDLKEGARGESPGAAVCDFHGESESFPSVALRSFAGPEATELFVLARPDVHWPEDICQQTESVYAELEAALSAHGGTVANVVRELVFFRDIAQDLEVLRAARPRTLGRLLTASAYRPASIYIEQSPLHEVSRVEVLAEAVIPHPVGSTSVREIRTQRQCSCSSCSDSGARVMLLGGEKHIYSGNVFGASGGGVYEEACDMFRGAAELLQRERAEFGSVVRTWVYLRDVERDYDDFHRARREFFKGARGAVVRPASTTVSGAPFPREHNLCMSFHAVQSPRPFHAQPMATPALAEAWKCGSDTRGLKVMDANKTALYISGTPSIDEESRPVRDLDEQVEGSLRSVSALLEKHGASFRDVVSATTYVRRPPDAPRVQEILADRGIDGFPNAMVQAALCRPELLCEMEFTALLPSPRLNEYFG